MDFPKRLKMLRKQKGLSQTELGQLYNYSKQTISSYENGGSFPTQETLQKLAGFFDVTVDYLLGVSNMPNSPKIDELFKEPELLEVWNKINSKEELRELFQQTHDLPSNDLKTILAIVKAVVAKDNTK